MPDITMCKDKNCPINHTCYRFTAIPCEYRQSYFVNSPREKDIGCVYYIEATVRKADKSK